MPEVVGSIGWFARFSRICQNKQSDSRGQQFSTTKQTNERLRIVQTTKALTASTLFWIGKSVGETRWDKTREIKIDRRNENAVTDAEKSGLK